MELSSLVYVSQAEQPFEETSLNELAQFATERNRLAELTGYLHFAGGRFTQYLEGPREPLEALFESIRHDARHSVLAVATDEGVAARRFPHWGMRWVRDEEMREIQLETVLADHLLLAKEIERVTQYQAPLWRMVDALAGANRGGSGLPSPGSGQMKSDQR